MLRRPAMVVVMLLVSLIMACAPQAVISTPTPAGTSAVPKATSGAVSVATPKPAVEKPQRGGTLTFAMDGEAGELDPHKILVGASRRWTRLMYNTLTGTDESGNVIPELAESWSNPDPQTYEFKLRKGVKFHDGTDFNAQAVKFNIERVQDPATKAYKRSLLSNITSVESTDDYTVRFHLKTPQGSLPGLFSDLMVAGIISPASVKKWGDETVTHPVGTGPFEFVEWVKGDHLTVKRFKDYWRKDQFGEPLPYLDQVVIKPIPDATVRLTNVRTSAVDLMDWVPSSQLSAVKADKSLKTVDWGNAEFWMSFNCAKPPFDSKALRQAVNWGLDREAIQKAIYGGTGYAGQYYLDPRHWAFDATGKFYTRDLAKAKEKLAEGGKPNGFKFVAKDYDTGLELQVAQAVKGQLADVGIDMEIVPVQARQLSAERVAGNFEAVFNVGNGLVAEPDVELTQYFGQGQPGDNGKCATAQMSELLDKARQSYDKAERKALYAKVQEFALDNAPHVYIHQDVLTSAMSQKLMGFTPNIDLYGFRLDWLWLKK